VELPERVERGVDLAAAGGTPPLLGFPPPPAGLSSIGFALTVNVRLAGVASTLPYGSVATNSNERGGQRPDTAP
jgi:hypothetical protein